MGAQNRVWSGALLSLTEWKATPTCQGGLLQSARQHSRAELQKNMDMKHSDQVFHLLSFYPPGGQLLCSVMDSISSPRCSDWCTWHNPEHLFVYKDCNGVLWVYVYVCNMGKVLESKGPSAGMGLNQWPLLSDSQLWNVLCASTSSSQEDLPMSEPTPSRADRQHPNNVPTMQPFQASERHSRFFINVIPVSLWTWILKSVQKRIPIVPFMLHEFEQYDSPHFFPLQTNLWQADHPPSGPLPTHVSQTVFHSHIHI